MHASASMTIAPSQARLFRSGASSRGPYGDEFAEFLNSEGFEQAHTEIAAWPGYQPTPLVSLAGLAKSAGLGAIYYKHEADRFGLGSFKALGGAYAVLRHLQDVIERSTGTRPSPEDLRAGRFALFTKEIGVCSATDGNHGRSVAWGAQVFGCRCTIYIHAKVSEGRRAAIARYGAEVIRHPGNYDDAVRRCAADAARYGWTVISDTSYEGYTTIPRNVMYGYGVMADEAAEQMALPPTHMVVQAGVGGLAAAVVARLWQRYGADRPTTATVEPINAACLYESARLGHRVTVEGALETVMAGLSCGEVSMIAWPIIEAGVDVFMTVDDAAAETTMRLLADGTAGDKPLVAGESAVAGLAALLAAAADPEMRAGLRLAPDSRVLLFGTEGATDPELYRRIVGRPPELVWA